MKPRLARPLGVLLLGGLMGCVLCGCTQWHYDLGTALPASEPTRQNMPLQEVLQLLGPPLRMTATDTGFVLAWEHWQIAENKIGITLGALGAQFMSADWGEMRAKGEFLLLTFNKEHLLTGAARSHWDNDGGGGKAIQPLGIVSVVDADGLLGPLPQLRWGGAQLQRLPYTLNLQSSPDTGQSGLQQRGTPTAVGQESLQME